MTENSAETYPVPTQWLAMPDLVEALDVPLGRVRRLIDESYLVGSTRNGVFAVPAIFIVDGVPQPALRGTIIVLKDLGLSNDEIIDWMLAYEESMGRAPIESLLAGHKSEVRRIARTLA